MKGKKLLLIIIPSAIVFMAGIVFLALWLSRGRPDYQGAANYVGEILKHESIIEEYVNSNENFGYDEIDRDALGSFQNSVTSINSYYESLRASTAQTNKEVAERYGEISPFIDKLSEVASVQNALVSYVDKVNTSGYASANTELGALAASPNAFIITLGSNLSDYYKSLAEFEEKYQNGKAGNYNKMIEEYGNFVIAGEKLSAKYANVTFEEIFNISPTSVANYFDQLRDFESYLRAQQ